MLPDFMLYYKAIGIKTSWFWHKAINQWNRVESPEINPATYDFLIYNKGGKNIQRRTDSVFSKCCWGSWTVICKSVILEHFLTTYTKINSKWLKDLNIRNDTVKFLEKNIGKTFSDINHTNVFLGQSPMAIEKQN